MAQTVATRQMWLGILARAEPGELELAYEALEDRPTMTRLRAPEVGLVMVRARAGGSGRPFNLGEVPVARCSVKAPDGRIGHGYVRGRHKRHAELVACFDALLQDPARTATLQAAVVEPLAKRQQERRDAIRGKAEATRVEFFTLVRGE